MSSDYSETDKTEDVQVLHSMGYAQELERRLSRFSNFAVSFSIICILSGGINSLAQATSGAGGIGVGIGWLVGCFVSLTFAVAMSQISSAYPTAGGLYHWGSILGNRGTGWVTAWLNLLGLITVLGAINVGTWTFFIGAFGPALGIENNLTTQTIFLVIITGAQALINHLGIKLTARLTDFSGYLIFGGSILIALVCLFAADSWDFSRLVTFKNYSGEAGGNVWPQVSNSWVFLLGLLLPIYTITGYDASAHMSEETHDAHTSAPRGIVFSVVVSVIMGFILLTAMNVGITPDKVFTAADGTANGAAGYQHALDSAATLSNAGPPITIWIDAVGQTGGLIVLLLVIGAQFYCGMSSVTANSRMIYAFSRDGAVPFSNFWHRINPRTRTPTNSIWLAAVGAFILALPYLYSPVAYAAVTSIAVIGLYVAYVAPVFLRVRAGSKFQEGPWTLGRWSRPIGITATIWVIFISILFMLPQAQPITINTFNYTPIVFLIVLGGAALWWVVSAKNWFHGPKVQGTAEELAAIEHELEMEA